jgi:hypothetical protein
MTDDNPEPSAPATEVIGNDQELARMRDALKAPGTKLGLLVRRFERVLGDLKEGLENYGQASYTAGALGAKVKQGIKSTASISVRVEVEGGEPLAFRFQL